MPSSSLTSSGLNPSAATPLATVHEEFLNDHGQTNPDSLLGISPTRDVNRYNRFTTNPDNRQHRPDNRSREAVTAVPTSGDYPQELCVSAEQAPQIKPFSASIPPHSTESTSNPEYNRVLNNNVPVARPARFQTTELTEISKLVNHVNLIDNLTKALDAINSIYFIGNFKSNVENNTPHSDAEIEKLERKAGGYAALKYVLKEIINMEPDNVLYGRLSAQCLVRDLYETTGKDRLSQGICAAYFGGTHNSRLQAMLLKLQNQEGEAIPLLIFDLGNMNAIIASGNNQSFCVGNSSKKKDTHTPYPIISLQKLFPGEETSDRRLILETFTSDDERIQTEVKALRPQDQLEINSMVRKMLYGISSKRPDFKSIVRQVVQDNTPEIQKQEANEIINRVSHQCAISSRTTSV